MPIVGATCTPVAAEALGPSYTGRAVKDSTTILSDDPSIANARYVPYEVQCEILNLIRAMYGGGGAIEIFNGSAVDIQHGPICICGVYGSDSVSGNSIFNVCPADAAQDSPACAILSTTLAKLTRGSAYFGGNFASSIDTTSYTIGREVYVAINGGVTCEKPDDANFIQIVGNVKTQGVNGMIAGFIRPAVFAVEQAEEESAFV